MTSRSHAQSLKTESVDKSSADSVTQPVLKELEPTGQASQAFIEPRLQPAVNYILDVQLETGEIPWFTGGHTDPWDHVEAAMGLTIGGEFEAAAKAYRWLASVQLDDGSWWASYRDGEPDKFERRETNYVAYIATGLWHYYLCTRDKQLVVELMPTVRAAIEFVVSAQREQGDIDWAVGADGSPMPDALVTGCSSIYKSLECAINLAKVCHEHPVAWELAREKLGDCLRNKPERFDRTWESKSRYSMDWFYPVLTGVFQGEQAEQRIASRWDAFVKPGMGCRCVVEEPWVTVAESCELVLALLAIGDRDRAIELFEWLFQWRDHDGTWWTGYQFVEDVLWPLEKPTWTAGAVLLASDAINQFTAGSKIFS